MFKAIRNTLSLYLGKFGGVVSTIIFIPFFRRSFTANEFGWITLVFSIQALIYVLDFGLSTHLARRASRINNSIESKKRFGLALGLAHFTIRFFYFLVAGFFALIWVLRPIKLSLIYIGTTILLLGFQTELNLWSQLLLSLKRYELSSYIQLAATLARGGLSYILVRFFGPHFINFLLGQVIAGYCFQLLAKKLIEKLGFQIGFWKTFQMYLLDFNKRRIRYWYSLLAKSWPLFLSMVFGALAAQADRWMIATFISPTETGNYFIALTYSMTPVLLVAQPLFQYFQPFILSTFDSNKYPIWLERYCLTLYMVVLAATLVLYLMMNELFMVWLHLPNVTELMALSKYLLGGSTMAAYSFIGYSILVAAGQYRELKVIAIVSSFIYLGLLYLSCFLREAKLVAISFFLFNLISYSWQLYVGRNYWSEMNRKLVLRFFSGSLVFSLVFFLIPDKFFWGSFEPRIAFLLFGEVSIISGWLFLFKRTLV